jgi:hypothetical protein
MIRHLGRNYSITRIASDHIPFQPKRKRGGAREFE